MRRSCAARTWSSCASRRWGQCSASRAARLAAATAWWFLAEDINLHFTGDFHAIGAANNLLAALLDAHIQNGNELNIDVRKITWKRVVDMNDRQLRHIADGLGGKAHGVPCEDGFDITVASEVMAIFLPATSITDLEGAPGRYRGRLHLRRQTRHSPRSEGRRRRGRAAEGRPKAELVQTLEGTLTFVHGHFANIAHGCNSIMATRMAMALRRLLRH